MPLYSFLFFFIFFRLSIVSINFCFHFLSKRCRRTVSGYPTPTVLYRRRWCIRTVRPCRLYRSSFFWCTVQCISFYCKQLLVVRSVIVSVCCCRFFLFDLWFCFCSSLVSLISSWREVKCLTQLVDTLFCAQDSFLVEYRRNIMYVQRFSLSIRTSHQFIILTF